MYNSNNIYLDRVVNFYSKIAKLVNLDIVAFLNLKLSHSFDLSVTHKTLKASVLHIYVR